MASEPHEFRIRRLIVALDASASSLAALEAATRLAARLEAEVAGLFVEDEQLIALAGLPVARVVGHAGPRSEPLTVPEMARALRLLSERARLALEQAAGRARVRWSFRVLRGRPSTTLVSEAREGDLLCVGRAGRAFAGRRHLGSTARAASRSAATVLLLPEGAPPQRPVLLAYDGSSAARRALAAAGTFAREGARTVTLLGPPGVDPAVLQEAESSLLAGGLFVRRRLLPAAALERLAEIVRDEGGGTLVLPRGVLATTPEELNRLLEDVRSPVLLVP